MSLPILQIKRRNVNPANDYNYTGGQPNGLIAGELGYNYYNDTLWIGPNGDTSGQGYSILLNRDRRITAANWKSGTVSGPTLEFTEYDQNGYLRAFSSSAIPNATITQSGIVTTADQAFAGQKTFGDLVFRDSLIGLLPGSTTSWFEAENGVMYVRTKNSPGTEFISFNPYDFPSMELNSLSTNCRGWFSPTDFGVYDTNNFDRGIWGGFVSGQDEYTAFKVSAATPDTYTQLTPYEISISSSLKEGLTLIDTSGILNTSKYGDFIIDPVEGFYMYDLTNEGLYGPQGFYWYDNENGYYMSVDTGVFTSELEEIELITNTLAASIYNSSIYMETADLEIDEFANIYIANLNFFTDEFNGGFGSSQIVKTGYTVIDCQGEEGGGLYFISSTQDAIPEIILNGVSGSALELRENEIIVGDTRKQVHIEPGRVWIYGYEQQYIAKTNILPDGIVWTVNDTTKGSITATQYTGNASTATKLATARTISFTGDASASFTFDGSADKTDITLTLANSGVTAGNYGQTSSTSPGYGGTISVPYITVDAKGRVTSAATRTVTLPASDQVDTKNTTGSTNSTSKLFLVGATSQAANPVTYSNSAVYATNGTLYATTFSGALSGNAATATKLATARTIALTGDVTGSGSFDGSGNLSIAAIVVDDSHNHTKLSDGGQFTTTAECDAVLSKGKGLYYNCASQSGTSIGNDGIVISAVWSNTYGAQIWLDDGSGAAQMQVRNRTSSAWNAWRKVWMQGDAITGAVWNDYAECRESDCKEAGYVLSENGNDTLSKSIERLAPFAGVSSDTWGFSQGETEKAKTHIAVAGRVLVYTYKDRNSYKPGDCVCAAPNGTVDIMTREEIIQYPDRIVGIVSCVPEYKEWGGGEMADRPSVKVNGRIWIKIK